MKSEKVLERLKSGTDMSYVDDNDPYYPGEMRQKIGEEDFMNAKLPE